VLVAPAVREPLAEPGAGHLPAELGPEAAAGVAGAGRHRALDVAQIGLHVRLERVGDRGSQLHARPASRKGVILVVEPDLGRDVSTARPLLLEDQASQRWRDIRLGEYPLLLWIVGEGDDVGELLTGEVELLTEQ
jgi:hypothetical protein